MPSPLNCPSLNEEYLMNLPLQRLKTSTPNAQKSVLGVMTSFLISSGEVKLLGDTTASIDPSERTFDKFMSWGYPEELTKIFSKLTPLYTRPREWSFSSPRITPAQMNLMLF